MNHRLYNLAYSILLAAAICGVILMAFGWMFCLTDYALAGMLTLTVSFTLMVVTLVIEREHYKEKQNE